MLFFGVRMWRQQSTQGHPDFPVYAHVLQMIWGCSQDLSSAFLRRRQGDIENRSPSHLRWLFSTWRNSGSTPSSYQTTELPTLSLGTPSHLALETHFNHSYLRSCLVHHNSVYHCRHCTDPSQSHPSPIPHSCTRPRDTWTPPLKVKTPELLTRPNSAPELTAVEH